MSNYLNYIKANCLKRYNVFKSSITSKYKLWRNLTKIYNLPDTLCEG